jgi:hypothetical protein
MATTLDFGTLSLEDAIAQKALQEEMLNTIGQHLEEASAYTKSGKIDLDLNKSRAIMESAYERMPLPHGMEGKTVAEVSKSANLLRSSNMMLDAIIAAKTPLDAAPIVTQAPANITPQVPDTFRPPKPLLPNLNNALRLLGPAANFLQLATYPSDLNEGEDAALAQRRKQPPTIR